MSAQVWLAGFALGFGAALVASWCFARRPSLERRIATHLRTPTGTRRHIDAVGSTPFPTLERLLTPVLRDGVRAVEKWGAPAQELRTRLRRAGSEMTVEQFRAQQVLWGVASLGIGVVLSLLMAFSRGSSPVALFALTAVCAVSGVMARDYWLSRAVASREARMVSELPTVAELLALSVSAGEGAMGALERVSRTTSGVLATEMSVTLAHARTGTPLTQSLHHLADRSRVPALRRFADGIATAVERGTPLAEVLRAQAQDVRADGRRALMEEGGKREIAMMIPVVFLILPVTVVFAVFPGLVAIQLGI